MSIDRQSHAAIRARVHQAVRDTTGLHDEFSRPISERIMASLIEQFRGERIYFCSPRRARDTEIMRDFTGANHDSVCRRHRISRRTLYRVLHRTHDGG